MYRATGIVTAILVAAAALAAPAEIPLLNPSFEGALGQNGVPEGWTPYGGGETLFSLVDGAADGARALLIDDPDPAGEGGLMQDFPVQAGENVRVRVSVRAVQEGSSSGAYLQLRF
ncbi:MAG TPA: hypothetical protein DEP45_02445, partial [Armatimonadetes bacterium]|nr:hypothetical protein [Armatimonadota bacterium]